MLPRYAHSVQQTPNLGNVCSETNSWKEIYKPKLFPTSKCRIVLVDDEDAALTFVQPGGHVSRGCSQAHPQHQCARHEGASVCRRQESKAREHCKNHSKFKLRSVSANRLCTQPSFIHDVFAPVAGGGGHKHNSDMCMTSLGNFQPRAASEFTCC